MVLRPRHISSRPKDEPMFTRPDDLDFEKRKMIFPPGFIKEIVLKGGDEYVTADDIATVVNLVVANIKPVLDKIEAHLSEVTGTEYGKREIEENA